MLTTQVNGYIFYYGTGHLTTLETYSVSQELSWRHCYHTLDINSRIELVYMLNVTRITSEDKFAKNWNSIVNILDHVNKCSQNTISQSNQEIMYLDTNCFNFVKTMHICKFYPNCIWRMYHHTNEFQKILYSKNIFTCSEEPYTL